MKGRKGERQTESRIDKEMVRETGSEETERLTGKSVDYFKQDHKNSFQQRKSQGNDLSFIIYDATDVFLFSDPHAHCCGQATASCT